MKYDLETFFLQLTIYLMTSLTRKLKQTKTKNKKIRDTQMKYYLETFFGISYFFVFVFVFVFAFL
jgi:hypothetical protein